MSEFKIINVPDGDWKWGEDYIYPVAKYQVNCPADRVCQVGMGIFNDGNPLGEKIIFSGTEEITVIGVGSLHFRVDDNQGPCQVGFRFVSIVLF